MHRVVLTNTTLPRYLWWNPSRLLDVCTHVGRSRDLPNMDYEPGKSKLLAEGNWEEISHKSSSNRHEGVTQQLSLPESACVYTHVLYYFPLNKCFPCFTTFHLCGNSFYKAEGPESLSLTTGLVARIWCSHHHHLASISGWKPKCCSKPLQAQVT